MIDASSGYMKDGPKNRLRAQDIHKIVDVFDRRAEVPGFSRMVWIEEIEKNDFNLNLPRYIDSQQEEDLQDIEGHLRGGIPGRDVNALKHYWTVCPGVRKALFKPNRPGYVDLRVAKDAIKPTIYNHLEFTAFITRMNEHFGAWRSKSEKKLKMLTVNCHPKQVITELADGLLAHYEGQALIDAYDVYQHLMNFWDETMQDDCYLIAADGWKAETYRVIETKKGKDGKPGRQVDKGWTCDLVPKHLLVARFYAKEQAAIEQFAADLEGVTALIAELEEENGGEEGVFAEFDKVNKPAVTARLKEIQGDKTAKEEIAVLRDWQELNGKETELRKSLREAETALDAVCYARYPKLTEVEVKTLVVEDKWIAALDKAIHGEMDRISQTLTQRVKVLAERYGTPLPQMVGQVAELEAKVNRHLERMGFAWS
jgi:type I restriction enzyme M protein